jgi:uncharacterized ferritin-like protein (DUF455 family)
MTEMDPTLFAEGPARDNRFMVKDRFVEMHNVPEDDPTREVEFFHRQMHEELNSVENAARNLSDFPNEDWDIRMWIARQCSDEARHVLMFREIYESRGGKVGQYPVLNFQYKICTKIDNLLGRLTVQNRSFEAGGIDAVKVAIEDARERGDEELALLYEAQGADEIVHVRFANDWIRKEVQKSPRKALQMATALTAASKAFSQVMGLEGTTDVDYTADVSGRLEAGFDQSEVDRALAESAAKLEENRARRNEQRGNG